MRLLIQKVLSAQVVIEKSMHSSIETGLLILLGFHKEDTVSYIEKGIDKILGLRIFPDAEGIMQWDITQVQGSILVVSQFTLYGDCSKGRRPSFTAAAKSEEACLLYDQFLLQLKNRYPLVQSGVFGAQMDVSLVNSGPMTLFFDFP